MLGVSSSVWDCKVIRRWAEDARRERGSDKGCVLVVITKRILVHGKRRSESTLQLYNDDADRPVSARNESSFQALRGLRLAELLVCPSRDLDAFDHGGSSARTLP